MSEPRSQPSAWRRRTLGSLARYINGRAFRPDEWKSAGLPVIRIQQMNNRDAAHDFFDGIVSDSHRIDDGDLLFSWSATLTTQIWDRGSAVLNQHIFKVIPEPDIAVRFLHQLREFEMDELRVRPTAQP
jgi:type I restriction enzyme, S subunit